MPKITIAVGAISLQAELNDSSTARQIWESLPIEGTVNTWGDEIYFEIPVIDKLTSEARAEVDVGELGYWPVGKAFCVFFGPTPVSTDECPRAYSPVNIVGYVLDDATALKTIEDGERIRIVGKRA